MSIKLGEYDITVYGDPYKYDAAKMKDFEVTVAGIIRSEIATRKTGQIVLSRIRKTPGVVEIYPRYEEGLNAEAEFAWKTNDKGRRIGRDPLKVLVWYKPEQWGVSRPNSWLFIPSDLRAFKPADLRDEILFHELTHCGRLLDGYAFSQVEHSLDPNIKSDITNAPMPYADKETAAYDNIEEFVTILVTNIFLSEKGARVFRASHGRAGYPFILDKAQSTSEGFIEKKGNYGLVKLFCQTDPIAPKLAEIDTYFNPVRAYFGKNLQDIELNKSLQQPTPKPKPVYGGVVGPPPV